VGLFYNTSVPEPTLLNHRNNQMMSNQNTSNISLSVTLNYSQKTFRQTDLKMITFIN